MFFSTDSGATWVPVNEGFRNARSLMSKLRAPTVNYLFAGTFGEGVWRKLLERERRRRHQVIGNGNADGYNNRKPTATHRAHPPLQQR